MVCSQNFVKIFGIIVMLLCLVFSGLQFASIKNTTSDRAMTDHVPSVLGNGSRAQLDTNGNSSIEMPEDYKFDQELEKIIETSDEYLDNSIDQLYHSIMPISSEIDNRLQSNEEYSIISNSVQEIQKNKAEARQETSYEQNEILSRSKRRSSRAKKRRRVRAHYTERASRHTHYDGAPCEYRRSFYFVDKKDPIVIPPGANTTDIVDKYVWGECNKKFGPAKQRMKVNKALETSSTANHVNDTNATNASTSEEIEVENIYMCPRYKIPSSSAQKLGFVSPVLPALIMLRNFGRN